MAMRSMMAMFMRMIVITMIMLPVHMHVSVLNASGEVLEQLLQEKSGKDGQTDKRDNVFLALAETLDLDGRLGSAT